MIDVVEETLDLQVDHPVKLPASLPRLPHCIQSRLPRPIAKGIRVEQRIYHRFRSRLHHHLRDPVRSSGNPQLPFSAVSLRYLHPPHRRRKPTLVVTIVRSIRPQIVVSTETLVVTIVRSIRPQIVVSTETARRHPIPDFVQVPFQVPFEIRNRLLVDACRSLIGLYPFIRFQYLPLRNYKRLQPPARHDWLSPTSTHEAERPLGTPCRRADRSGIPARSSPFDTA